MIISFHLPEQSSLLFQLAIHWQDPDSSQNPWVLQSSSVEQEKTEGRKTIIISLDICIITKLILSKPVVMAQNSQWLSLPWVLTKFLLLFIVYFENEKMLAAIREIVAEIMVIFEAYNGNQSNVTSAKRVSRWNKLLTLRLRPRISNSCYLETLLVIMHQRSSNT